MIAAEPEMADDAFRSFAQKEFVPSVNPQTIADGLRTSLGTLTYPIIFKYVDEILTASEPAIVQAMRLMWERMKIIIEPSSAVPLAALMQHQDRFRKSGPGLSFPAEMSTLITFHGATADQRKPLPCPDSARGNPCNGCFAGKDPR